MTELNSLKSSGKQWICIHCSYYVKIFS